MSRNIFITATVKATLHLANGATKHIELCESFDCWQTPTDVSDRILSRPETNAQLDVYKGWVLSTPIARAIIEHVEWDENDPTLQLSWDDDGNQVAVGDSIRRRQVTNGEFHIEEFNKWLKQHEGWAILVSSL